MHAVLGRISEAPISRDRVCSNCLRSKLESRVWAGDPSGVEPARTTDSRCGSVRPVGAAALHVSSMAPRRSVQIRILPRGRPLIGMESAARSPASRGAGPPLHLLEDRISGGRLLEDEHGGVPGGRVAQPRRGVASIRFESRAVDPPLTIPGATPSARSGPRSASNVQSGEDRVALLRSAPTDASSDDLIAAGAKEAGGKHRLRPRPKGRALAAGPIRVEPPFSVAAALHGFVGPVAKSHDAAPNRPPCDHSRAHRWRDPAGRFRNQDDPGAVATARPPHVTPATRPSRSWRPVTPAPNAAHRRTDRPPERGQPLRASNPEGPGRQER